MTPVLQTRYTTLTDVGRLRPHNEDACGASPDVGAYVVCDGMGGAAAGEIASRETVAAFLACCRQLQLAAPIGLAQAERLEQAVLSANRTIFEMARHDPRLRGMGTTLVALQTEPSMRRMYVTHVGDSRCYRLRQGLLERLTNDHSVVEEQMRLGELTEAQARRSHLRNVITRVVGSQRSVVPETVVLPCQPGDLFLLCSDGLTRDLSDCDLRSILGRYRGDLDRAARVLIDAANLQGGGDNITVLLLEILAYGNGA